MIALVTLLSDFAKMMSVSNVESGFVDDYGWCSTVMKHRSGAPDFDPDC